MKVSVIVPVYNVELFVEACLRSVMRQTFRNLEILVIDDGSKDRSGAICDRLSREDGRIQVFHQANGGLSAARNCGLRHASGDYVALVDSDDLLDPFYLENLLEACEQHQASAAVCDCRSFRETKEWEEVLSDKPGESECNDKGEVQIFSSRSCLEHIYHPLSSGMSFTAWGKLYRRSLFIENEIGYPAGKIHEDQFVTYRLIDAARTIVYIPRELYWYRIRQGSIMHKAFDRSRMDLMEATNGQCGYFLTKGETDLAALAVNNHIRTEFSLLACVRENDGEESCKMRKEIEEAIRKDCRRLLPCVSLPVWKKTIYRLAAAVPANVFIKKLRMF